MKCILTHTLAIYKAEEKAQVWQLVLVLTSCLILGKILRHFALYLPQLSLSLFFSLFCSHWSRIYIQTLKCGYFIALASSVLPGINLAERLSLPASDGHIVIWPVNCKFRVVWDFRKGAQREQTPMARVYLDFADVCSPFLLPSLWVWWQSPWTVNWVLKMAARAWIMELRERKSLGHGQSESLPESLSSLRCLPLGFFYIREE